MDREPKPPFRVVLVDQFQGHDEYGYDDTGGTYDNLEEATSVAKQITVEAIAEFNSLDDWYGMGDAGLVYDSTGMLVWDGIREAIKQVDQKE